MEAIAFSKDQKAFEALWNKAKSSGARAGTLALLRTHLIDRQNTGRGFYSLPGVKEICQNLYGISVNDEGYGRPGAGSLDFLYNIRESLPSSKWTSFFGATNAYAGMSIATTPETEKDKQEHQSGRWLAKKKHCSELTYSDIAQAFAQHKNSGLSKFNRIAELELKAFRQRVIEKLESRFDGACKGKIDVIDVPVLFYPEKEAARDAKILPNTLPQRAYKAGSCIGHENSILKAGASPLYCLEGGHPVEGQKLYSAFPNMINGITSPSGSFIAPRPFNAAFQQYLEAETKKRGIPLQFEDTYAANKQNGNLHCMVKSFHVCK
jgi:hypothetical protein